MTHSTHSVLARQGFEDHRSSATNRSILRCSSQSYSAHAFLVLAFCLAKKEQPEHPRRQSRDLRYEEGYRCRPILLDDLPFPSNKNGRPISFLWMVLPLHRSCRSPFVSPLKTVAARFIKPLAAVTAIFNTLCSVENSERPYVGRAPFRECIYSTCKPGTVKAKATAVTGRLKFTTINCRLTSSPMLHSVGIPTGTTAWSVPSVGSCFIDQPYSAASPQASHRAYPALVGSVCQKNGGMSSGCFCY